MLACPINSSTFVERNLLQRLTFSYIPPAPSPIASLQSVRYKTTTQELKNQFLKSLSTPRVPLPPEKGNNKAFLILRTALVLGRTVNKVCFKQQMTVREVRTGLRVSLGPPFYIQIF